MKLVGKKIRLSIYILSVLFLFFQAIPSFSIETPDAGKSLQQIEQVPSAPSPKTEPIITVPGLNKPAPSSSEKRIKITSFYFSGNTIFAEEELQNVTEAAIGKELTLAELREIAIRVAAYYRQHGYIVAYAYIPPQQIRDGKIQIAISEGYYGKIDIHNNSALNETYIQKTLATVVSGSIIENTALQRAVLLLNDTPGIQVKSTLTPGAKPGTSDLIVDITPIKPVNGNIDLDNYGNRYTGSTRLGATVNVENPFKHGDQLSLRALTSGAGLQYAKINYLIPVSGQQTKIGAAYAAMNYKLGKDFSSLNAKGDANTFSLYTAHNWIRSLNQNLGSQITFDKKQLEDRIDTTNTVTTKNIHSLTFALIGDHKDNFSGGSFNSYSISLAAGHLVLNDQAMVEDETTAHSSGNYEKLSFMLNRLQYLSQDWAFLFSATGQLASKNLDSSEKIALGGPYGVRAYPQGEANGDEGILLTGELRMKFNSYLQFLAFIDSGTVTINKHPWTNGNNRRTLSGAGVGFNWLIGEGFLMRFSYARKIGNEVATSDRDQSGRLWLQLSKQF